MKNIIFSLFVLLAVPSAFAYETCADRAQFAAKVAEASVGGAGRLEDLTAYSTVLDSNFKVELGVVEYLHKVEVYDLTSPLGDQAPVTTYFVKATYDLAAETCEVTDVKSHYRKY